MPSQRERIDGGIDLVCPCGVRERWSEYALDSYASVQGAFEMMARTMAKRDEV